MQQRERNSEPEEVVYVDTKNVRPASAEQSFYLDWARETFKGNLAFVNEVLRQQVGLCAGLLGGGIAFLSDSLAPPWARLGALVCFFIAFLIAFLGMLPHASQVQWRSPDAIREHKERSLWRKNRFLKASGWTMIVGFIIALAGVATKALLP